MFAHPQFGLYHIESNTANNIVRSLVYVKQGVELNYTPQMLSVICIFIILRNLFIDLKALEIEHMHLLDGKTNITLESIKQFKIDITQAMYILEVKFNKSRVAAIKKLQSKKAVLHFIAMIFIFLCFFYCFLIGIFINSSLIYFLAILLLFTFLMVRSLRVLFMIRSTKAMDTIKVRLIWFRQFFFEFKKDSFDDVALGADKFVRPSIFTSFDVPSLAESKSLSLIHKKLTQESHKIDLKIYQIFTYILVILFMLQLMTVLICRFILYFDHYVPSSFFNDVVNFIGVNSTNLDYASPYRDLISIIGSFFLSLTCYTIIRFIKVDPKSRGLKTEAKPKDAKLIKKEYFSLLFAFELKKKPKVDSNFDRESEKDIQGIQFFDFEETEAIMLAQILGTDNILEVHLGKRRGRKKTSYSLKDSSSWNSEENELKNSSSSSSFSSIQEPREYDMSYDLNKILFFYHNREKYIRSCLLEKLINKILLWAYALLLLTNFYFTFSILFVVYLILLTWFILVRNKNIHLPFISVICSILFFLKYLIHLAKITRNDKLSIVNSLEKTFTIEIQNTMVGRILDLSSASTDYTLFADLGIFLLTQLLSFSSLWYIGYLSTFVENTKIKGSFKFFKFDVVTRSWTIFWERYKSNFFKILVAISTLEIFFVKFLMILFIFISIFFPISVFSALIIFLVILMEMILKYFFVDKPALGLYVDRCIVIVIIVVIFGQAIISMFQMFYIYGMISWNVSTDIYVTNNVKSSMILYFGLSYFFVMFAFESDFSQRYKEFQAKSDIKCKLKYTCSQYYQNEQKMFDLLREYLERIRNLETIERILKRMKEWKNITNQNRRKSITNDLMTPQFKLEARKLESGNSDIRLDESQEVRFSQKIKNKIDTLYNYILLTQVDKFTTISLVDLFDIFLERNRQVFKDNFVFDLKKYLMNDMEIYETNLMIIEQKCQAHKEKLKMVGSMRFFERSEEKIYRLTSNNIRQIYAINKKSTLFTSALKIPETQEIEKRKQIFLELYKQEKKNQRKGFRFIEMKYKNLITVQKLGFVEQSTTSSRVLPILENEIRERSFVKWSKLIFLCIVSNFELFVYFVYMLALVISGAWINYLVTFFVFAKVIVETNFRSLDWFLLILLHCLQLLLNLLNIYGYTSFINTSENPERDYQFSLVQILMVMILLSTLTIRGKLKMKGQSSRESMIDCYIRMRVNNLFCYLLQEKNILLTKIDPNIGDRKSRQIYDQDTMIKQATEIAPIFFQKHKIDKKDVSSMSLTQILLKITRNKSMDDLPKLEDGFFDRVFSAFHFKSGWDFGNLLTFILFCRIIFTLFRGHVFVNEEDSLFTQIQNSLVSLRLFIFLGVNIIFLIIEIAVGSFRSFSWFDFYNYSKTSQRPSTMKKLEENIEDAMRTLEIELDGSGSDAQDVEVALASKPRFNYAKHSIKWKNPVLIRYFYSLFYFVLFIVYVILMFNIFSPDIFDRFPNDFKAEVTFHMLYLALSFFQVRVGLPVFSSNSSRSSNYNMVSGYIHLAKKLIPVIKQFGLAFEYLFSKTGLSFSDWTFIDDVRTKISLYKFLNFDFETGMMNGFTRFLTSKINSGIQTFLLLFLIVFGPLILYSSLFSINYNFQKLVNPALGLSIVIGQTAFPLGGPLEATKIETISASTFFKTYQLPVNNFAPYEVWKVSFNPAVILPVQAIDPEFARFLYDQVASIDSTDLNFNVTFSFQMNRSQYSSQNALILSNQTPKLLFILSNIIYASSDQSLNSILELTGTLETTCLLENYESLSIFPVPSLQSPSLKLIYTSKSFGRTFYMSPVNESTFEFYLLNKVKVNSSISLIANITMIAFYTSTVLILVNFVLSYMSDNVYDAWIRWIPDPRNLLRIIESITVARLNFRFDVERHLYMVMIDIFRSPELVKLISKDVVDHFQEQDKKIVLDTIERIKKKKLKNSKN